MKRSARGAANPDPAATVKYAHKPGKPAHVPTVKSKKRVRLLSGLGFTQAEIGILMDLGNHALVKHYRKELLVGGLEADEQVMLNLFRMATGKGPEAGRMSIFYAKVKRKWHEVQRVIHGYDPDMIQTFVKGVVSMLRAELPDVCPGCKTHLGLAPKIAAQLHRLSIEMSAKLQDSEIVSMPRPELAADGLEAEG